MVCIRCETLVRLVLDKMGLKVRLVKSGEIEIEDQLSEMDLEKLNIALKNSGMGLLDEKKSVLIEKIKNAIIDLVYLIEDKPKINLSDFLKSRIGFDYSYLSELFAEVKGSTVEHFYITKRLDRAKEMLIYDDISIIEISDKLHFSDTSHFCNQFKKATGLTPTNFRKIMGSKNIN
jgi:YesN/AraC family two-component response regulator